MKYILFTLIAMLSACTDADWDKATRLGATQEIICYSGGNVVFTDISTGKPTETTNGIGYRSQNTDKYVQVYLDCLVQEY